MRSYALGYNVPIFLTDLAAMGLWGRERSQDRGWECPAEWKDFMEFGVEMFSRGLYSLPFKAFIIEADAKDIAGRSIGFSYAYVVHDLDDSIRVDLCLIDRTGTGELTELTYVKKENVWRYDRRHDDPELQWVYELAVKIVPMFCASLLSRDASLETVSPDAGANLQRKKGGKPPLLEYKILKIGGRVAGSQPRGAGTHASPRLHFRRGHIRELQDKRLIPVAPCLVGSKERGMILKDYEVAPVSPTDP